MNPLISVIFPCYNAEQFLEYSLESVLNQSYKQLEILCINDGSSDRTLDILTDYKRKDDRIVIINNEKNLGLIESLNKVLPLVNGDFFARMDSDDYSPPDRIEKQVSYLLSKNVDLLCSGFYRFRFNNISDKYFPPIATLSGSIKFLSLFSNPCVHGSIMAKSSLIKSGHFIYDKDFPHAEDFELFSRLSWSGLYLEALNEPLYWLRTNKNSVSYKFNDIQTETNVLIAKRNLSAYCNMNLADESILKIIVNRIDFKVSFEQILEAYNLLDKMLESNEKHYSTNEILEIKKYLILHKLNIFIQSNKYRFSKLNVKNLFFFIRTLFLLDRSHYFQLINKIMNKKS